MVRDWSYQIDDIAEEARIQINDHWKRGHNRVALWFYPAEGETWGRVAVLPVGERPGIGWQFIQGLQAFDFGWLPQDQIRRQVRVALATLPLIGNDEEGNHTDRKGA